MGLLISDIWSNFMLNRDCLSELVIGYVKCIENLQKRMIDY